MANGNGKVPLTWAQLGTLVITILSAAGYGGFKAAAPISPAAESIPSAHLQADHDQLTALGRDVDHLKSDVQNLRQESLGRFDRIDARGEQNQTMLRRILDAYRYEPGAPIPAKAAP